MDCRSRRAFLSLTLSLLSLVFSGCTEKCRATIRITSDSDDETAIATLVGTLLNSGFQEKESIFTNPEFRVFVSKNTHPADYTVGIPYAHENGIIKLNFGVAGINKFSSEGVNLYKRLVYALQMKFGVDRIQPDRHASSGQFLI